MLYSLSKIVSPVSWHYDHTINDFIMQEISKQNYIIDVIMILEIYIVTVISNLHIIFTRMSECYVMNMNISRLTCKWLIYELLIVDHNEDFTIRAHIKLIMRLCLNKYDYAFAILKRTLASNMPLTVSMRFWITW